MRADRLGAMVSSPGSPAAKAARGTVSGLKSHLIFTLSFGCCDTANVTCLLNPEGLEKGFPAQVCAPAISSPSLSSGIKESTWQLPLPTLNFVLFPDVGSPTSKNTVSRTCISCFPNVII